MKIALFILLLFLPLTLAVSSIDHRVDGSELIIDFNGDSPFYISIRSSKEISDKGGYVLAKTGSKSFSIDIDFVDEDSFFFSVKDKSWSDARRISISEYWKPRMTWQWQLSGDIDTSFDVDMYDIDLFDAPQKVIDELHSREKKVICYFSAGSWEDWRDDAVDFPDSVLGNDYEGWPGEKWLDIRQIDLLAPIMKTRLDLCKNKGFDGVEPDNIHAYLENTGFPLSYEDQINYNKWLANEAHERGLSIGLKNDPDQVNDLINYYDFAVVEECFEYDECDPFDIFVQNEKAVFGVEYNVGDKPNDYFCAEADRRSFSWMLMPLELDGAPIHSCR
jgi:hypothetical protein